MKKNMNKHRLKRIQTTTGGQAGEVCSEKNLN